MKAKIKRAFSAIRSFAPELMMVVGATLPVIALFMIDVKWGLFGAGAALITFSFLIGGD